MSRIFIGKYLTEITKLKRISGSTRESVIREAFKDLLKAWSRDQDLTFIPEYEIQTPARERRYVDGALLHTLRVPFGYWEAKDTDDDLDEEIVKKFRIGYPRTNIIFEDSSKAVLYQNGREEDRCSTTDVNGLYKLLSTFFAYERPEIAEFRKAVEQFARDLPAVIESLRIMIDSVGSDSDFAKSSATFLKHIRKAINPKLVEADVREMLIQHILTSEVFLAVFPGTTYHEDNNVSRELHKLERTFFKGNRRFQTLRGLEPYYASIRQAAARIESNREKQNFLKAIYENFYKVYNPKAAARLGIVYTPYQIVSFMTASTEALCERHFKRSLLHPDVDILDPSTGTGTFICDLLEMFAGQQKDLMAKYVEGLHANEVGVLPYYVANVNIEATFASITGEYREFPGLCLVDTLDNTYALRKQRGHMDSLFGSVSDENVERIRQQNSRTISVIIGNPPYRANQLNENQHNKNRMYPEIDSRIKKTYIAASNAQKTKMYDMYSRFFRWATDRLDADGILALITNRSFIEKATFDGFRATVVNEFNYIYIVDLGGSVIDDPRLSGTKHNVFGIKTGVAIVFLVRKKNQKGCSVYYARRPELETAIDKLAFLSTTNFAELTFDKVRPSDDHRWIEHSETQTAFSALIPIASKEAKSAKKASQTQAIFKQFSLGVITARDEWVYDPDVSRLQTKMKTFSRRFNETVSEISQFDNRETPNENLFPDSIKWSRALMARARAGDGHQFDKKMVRKAMFRPFTEQFLYYDSVVNEMQYKLNTLFKNEPNPSIAFMSIGSSNPLSALLVTEVFDYCLLKKGNGGTQAVSRWYYDKQGSRLSNITDWARDLFSRRYKCESGAAVSDSNIFYYVYAALHDPTYKERFALDLKRSFPRIPLHDNFGKWVSWGRELSDLHSRFRELDPYIFERTLDVSKKDAVTRLRSFPSKHRIEIDSNLSLVGIPAEVWQYKLSSRSVIDWVLTHYRKLADGYGSMADTPAFDLTKHLEEVIRLLGQVVVLSLRTQEIVAEMRS